MANREALRELQSRLAQRLVAARSEPRAASWLAFECAGQGVLVPLPSAGEIFPLSPLTAVAHTQPWFMGVANLRGLLHGVVDLASFLGLRERPAPETGREHARLLAFNPALGSHCAIWVDRLAGLRGAHQLRAVPQVSATPTSPSARPDFALAQWHDNEGRAWQEIDLAALAAHEQFLAIAA